MDFIDLKTQFRLIERQVRSGIDAVLERGNFIMGAEVQTLEQRLAAFCGVREAVAVANGTDALMLAMMGLGLQAGDEVITTPFSFFATAEAVMLLGATPVFVDIDARSYNLDPARIESAITLRTRGILPVSLYGQCADLDTINALAQTYKLWVIEDAAQSFGASYKGRRSCALSTAACTSFYPAKPLGCYGDGGACFTDDPGLAERLRQLRDHGQQGRYVHRSLGMNSRLDTVQAAVLLAKLEIFQAEIDARARLGSTYTQLLAAHCPTVGTPWIEHYNQSVYAQYTIQVAARDRVQQALKTKGIPTAVHYPSPLHLQPALAGLGHSRGSFPIAEAAADRVLSLPMHPYLHDAEQARVVSALAEVLAE